MNLNKYFEKRDFKVTPEPKGKMLKSNHFRFVVQKHQARNLHYDFRLEMDGVLKSWAVPKGPEMKVGEKRLAIQTEDHPVQYAKFHGTIPKGNYGAGKVEIWDEGKYEIYTENTAQSKDETALKQLKDGDLKFTLRGEKLNGSFALIRMKGKDTEWLLIKKKEEYESSVDLPSELQTEKLSIQEAWKKMNQPMLASLSKDTPKAQEGWISELKYDGYRTLIKINGGVDLYSRNGNKLSKDFPALIESLNEIKEDVILDGEIVVENSKGISDFDLMQNFKKQGKGNLKLYLFDVIYLKGYDLSSFELKDRKDLLKTLIDPYKLPSIQLAKEIKMDQPDFYDKIVDKGEEGIIMKNLESTYKSGARSQDWIKFKAKKTLDLVIVGYTAPQNSRKHFGSLLLAAQEGKDLRYIGNCGTGFKDEDLSKLHKKFKPIERKTSPLNESVKLSYNKGKITWLKPELLAEVSFSSFTKAGHLRHPVFIRLRTDKKEVDDMEKISLEKEVKSPLSNPDKLLIPEKKISKQDLLNYYLEVASEFIAFSKDRPVSMFRVPNGVTEQGFYQKDKGNLNLPDYVETYKSKGVEYLLVNNEDSLGYLVNLAAFEMHIWFSRKGSINEPDFVLLDLDPDKQKFSEVQEVAKYIRELCVELNIVPFVKTSGKSGLHILIPVVEESTYKQIALFAEVLAELVQKKFPETTTLERSIKKRKGKMYIDYMQNRRGQTMVAPFSVRATSEGSVSTPLEWSELDKTINPKSFTIKTVIKRLNENGNPWKDIFDHRSDIGDTLEKLQEIYSAD